MNKHDRPKLSKIQWHYIIIDEGHRIKNASCKLNADLKLYRSSHRLLLTGTPLQVLKLALILSHLILYLLLFKECMNGLLIYLFNGLGSLYEVFYYAYMSSC